MTQERPADRLMDKLLRAIDLSMKATEASREAVQEILRRGAAGPTAGASGARRAGA